MIISAMPGTGKSTYARQHPETCIDLDSSKFNNGPGDHNWKGYIRAIKTASQNYDLVLVSSHKILRQRLQRNGLGFYFVAYHAAGMQEAVNRVVTRGTQQPNEVIAVVLEREWDVWMNQVEVGAPLAVYRLEPGQYVDDALAHLEAARIGHG